MKNKGTWTKIPYANGDTSHSQQANGENPRRDDQLALPLDLARMCEDSVAIVAAAYMHHSTNSDHLLCRVIQPPGTIHRREKQIIYKSSSVTVSLYITFDDWHYVCSPGSIQRIIMNLVGNSLKYTSTGFIHISLTVESPNISSFGMSEPHGISSDGKLVVLRVSDSGKGISSEFLKSKLFMAFSQESSLAPGTGKNLIHCIIQMIC